MLLKTVLNCVHRHRSFVYEVVYFVRLLDADLSFPQRLLRPDSASWSMSGSPLLRFGMFSNLECVINLYAQIPDGAFQLCMTKEQLHCPEVLRPSVDQCRLGAPQGMGPVVMMIKTNQVNPGVDDPGILASGNVR